MRPLKVLLLALLLGVGGSCFAACRVEFGVRVCLPDSVVNDRVVRLVDGRLLVVSERSVAAEFVEFSKALGQGLADEFQRREQRAPQPLAGGGRN